MDTALTAVSVLFIAVSWAPLLPSSHWLVRVWEFPRLQIAAIISLLIAGYNKKIWDNLPLTSSWAGAISSILFFIILFSGFVEWWNYTFSPGYHQQGWHFTGAIILISVTIPLSLLVTVFIALFKKLSFIKLETSNIKLFFWISILLFSVWVIPILIIEIIELVSV